VNAVRPVGPCVVDIEFRNSRGTLQLIEPRGLTKTLPSMALQHHQEISRKYGNMTVGILRQFYGSFAPHCADSEKLRDVFQKLDVYSLNQLVSAYSSGKLERFCRQAALTFQPSSRP
jgi:hypothetical protein